MATKNPAIRAVEPGETAPAPKAPKTLVEAIADGDYLEILLAQRRDIVTSLPGEKGPAKAALHRQLSIISKEIETLEARAKQEGSESEAEAVTDGVFDAEAI